jgi:hypothetical protein
MANTLTWFLTVVLAVNVALFLGQTAIIELGGQDNFYNCQGTIIGQLEQSGCSGSSFVLNNTNPSSRLPSGETSVNPETGNVFTDAFTGVKNWFIQDLGLGYLMAILGAPSNVLQAMGLPEAISFILGAFWYGLTLFLIVAFLFGRDV